MFKKFLLFLFLKNKNFLLNNKNNNKDNNIYKNNYILPKINNYKPLYKQIINKYY